MNKVNIIASSNNTVSNDAALNDTALRLKVLATKKEGIRRKLAVTAEELRLKAKQLAVTAQKKENVRSNLAVIAKQLAVTAKEKESIRRKLVVTAEQLSLKAKQLAVTAKEKESIRQKLVVTAEQLSFKAKQLAVTAKEKESIRQKLVVTAEELRLKAKQLAVTAEELRLKAKLLAVTAKEKESVRSKLAVIAKQLAMTAQKKENVRSKLAIIAKQLAVTAKEKESIRQKLVVTAEELSLKAKLLAVTAKEKESIRRKLVVTAEQLSLKAKQLAVTAKDKESIRRKLVVTAEQLSLKAKLLAVTAKEKESVRSKLAIIAKQLAITAQKKENVRSKLAIIAKQLAVTAKEKESIRRKLVVTAEELRLKAKQLAVTAKEKESIRQKLVVTAEELSLKAKLLAVTAKEKESIRQKLVVTAEELRLKAKNIEQVEAKEDAILSSIDDGVMACDKDGTVVLFNYAAEILTGLSAKEAISKHYSHSMKFVRESDEKKSDDFISRTIISGQAMKMTSHTLLVKKDGHKISVADSTAPVRDVKGIIIGCVVVFRDITQERKIDKTKTEFVSLASHQLRTPLTTINWYSEMLLGEDVGKLNTKQKKYLNEIYKGSKRMVALVNALLNVSRMELGTFIVEPEPTNILKLAKSVLAEFKQQISQKKLKISEKYDDHLPVLKADPKLLSMVLQNVLSNAVKYTSDKGKIKFEITLSDSNGVVSGKGHKSNVLIKVSDSGFGIPKINQSKIFTKLYRADNVREKDTKGTGLGLYIAKAIVDQSGGKIWFKSKQNKGSIFYVSLPLAGMKKKKGTKALI